LGTTNQMADRGGLNPDQRFTKFVIAVLRWAHPTEVRQRLSPPPQESDAAADARM
jgi:hypothetical protein